MATRVRVRVRVRDSRLALGGEDAELYLPYISLYLPYISAISPRDLDLGDALGREDADALLDLAYRHGAALAHLVRLRVGVRAS